MANREKEIKSFNLELKDLNDSTGEVAFYFSSPKKDLENDTILTSAYSKTFKENKDNIYHNRDHSEACGKPSDFQVDSKGAFCVSKLAIKTIVGNDTYEQYKAGLIKGHSQEFETIISNDDPTGGRVIKEVKLWGVTSVTNIPANLNTPTISVKSFEEISNQMKKINDTLHKGNVSDNLSLKFVAEYVNLKSFIDSHRKVLNDLGIVHCASCQTMISPKEMETNKCPACGKFVNASKSLITQDFINKVKLL